LWAWRTQFRDIAAFDHTEVASTFFIVAATTAIAMAISILIAGMIWQDKTEAAEVVMCPENV
jgi:hypothetical protein